jgi:hypothetical protein
VLHYICSIYDCKLVLWYLIVLYIRQLEVLSLYCCGVILTSSAKLFFYKYGERWEPAVYCCHSPSWHLVLFCLNLSDQFIIILPSTTRKHARALHWEKKIVSEGVQTFRAMHILSLIGSLSYPFRYLHFQAFFLQNFQLISLFNLTIQFPPRIEFRNFTITRH